MDIENGSKIDEAIVEKLNPLLVYRYCHSTTLGMPLRGALDGACRFLRNGNVPCRHVGHFHVDSKIPSVAFLISKTSYVMLIIFLVKQ